MQSFQSSDLSTPSKEVPGVASRLKRSPKLVSVNVGGLTAFKCSYVQQLTKENEILMLQELHKQGMQRLQRMVNVSSASGRWFFSKLPEKAAGVATFLCNELASQVTDTDGRSDRILKLVVKLGGKSSLILINTCAPHCGHGQEVYKKYLKELKSKLNGVNKRRLVLICGDFNAQVSRKELNVEGRLGLSHRTNANGKLLVEFLKEKELTIYNHLAVTGKKGSRKHATFMPRSNSGGPSEIDYVVTNHVPAISCFKISSTIAYNLWMKKNFDHLALSIRVNLHQHHTSKKRPRSQLDYSVLKSNAALQEKISSDLKEVLELNDTLTDTYLTLTHSIPSIMKKHLPEVKYNLPEHQNSEQTMSLMRYKPANWSNLNPEEKKRITNEVKRSAKEDYNNWLERIASEIETAFQSNNTRTGYQLIKKVKPVRKQFGKITKNTAGKLVGTAVVGETIEAVTRYKYLGTIFDPQGINADAISKKLNEAHSHINRFRDILSSSSIQKKTRINLARALVIAPVIYNVENWPSNVKITKALTKISRRLKRTIDRIDSFDFQLEEDNLDLVNIIKKRQENHKSTAKDIIDKELTALREYQLQNPSPPPTAKPIYYYEALALLGEEPVPPEDPPPSHFTHFPENENQPSNCARNQEPEEHLNRNQKNT
eukprot:augustus_masked-scaffold_45-processed-gene-0.5-mRNA-1 protein AED:1.00 eAED:1.00 QI:0/0/0/0/1/1/2/0/656